MSISTSEIPMLLQPRLFSIEEYQQMIAAGIFSPAERIELRKGILYSTTQQAARLFTVDEYQTLGELNILKADEHVELIDGEVVVMSPMKSPHVAYLIRLNKLLVALVGPHALVSVQSSVRFAPRSEPEPDVAVLRPRDDEYEGELPTAADILFLIEVSDTTLQQDRLVKVPFYARSGVPETWIVNLNERIVEVYSDPVDGRYNSLRYLSAADRLPLPGFPDLELELKSLFK